MDLDCRVREENAGFWVEMLRRLLSISYKDHVTNEKVRRNIQAAIGEYDERLPLVKKRKLRLFGTEPRKGHFFSNIYQKRNWNKKI